MKLIEDSEQGKVRLQEIDERSVLINNHRYEQSVIVTPDKVQDWPTAQTSSLSQEDMKAIIAIKPDIFILGTGPKFSVPSENLLKALFEAKIGVEFMDNYAGARTYKVLCSENRNVCLALFFPK